MSLQAKGEYQYQVTSYCAFPLFNKYKRFPIVRKGPIFDICVQDLYFGVGAKRLLFIRIFL